MTTIHAPDLSNSDSPLLETCKHFLEMSVNGDRKGAGVDNSTRHPQKIAREICDLLGCDPVHKDRVPALRSELNRFGVSISERRARGIYNGEVDRLWDDEREAMGMVLSRLRASRDRLTYADAALKISRDLAASGLPLTATQEQVISRSLH